MKKKPDSKETQMPFRMKTAVFDEFAFPFPGNDSQIRCVVRFEGKIDAGRLLKAIRLMYDAEPILGCRFVNHWRRYYWQRFDCIDTLIPNDIVETDHMETDINLFLLQPMDPLAEPSLQIKLFRKDHDILCLKICHMVSDAGGLKDILYRLSTIYKKLGENPEYTPEINIKGDRSFRQVYKHFSMADRLKIIKQGFLNWKSDTFPRKGWTFPLDPGDLSDKEFIVKHFDKKRYKALKAACSTLNCTLHELFSAAVLRTLHRIIGPSPAPPLRLGTSVDLRRYIPGGKGDAVCNLSTFFLLNIGPEIGSTFEGTVKKVQQALLPLKRDYLGLGFYQPVLIHFKEIMPSTWARSLCDGMLRFNQRLSSGDVCPRLTNMGAINEKKLVFDNVVISECFLVPPVCHPPIVMPALTSFGETLTLTISFSCAATNRNKIINYINILNGELKQIERKG